MTSLNITLPFRVGDKIWPIAETIVSERDHCPLCRQLCPPEGEPQMAWVVGKPFVVNHLEVYFGTNLYPDGHTRYYPATGSGQYECDGDDAFPTRKAAKAEAERRNARKDKP
jgi:hypothetical protein